MSSQELLNDLGVGANPDEESAFCTKQQVERAIENYRRKIANLNAEINGYEGRLEDLLEVLRSTNWGVQLADCRDLL